MSTNFAIWWDSDLLRELEDGTNVTKFDVTTNRNNVLMSCSACASNNTTKATPVLQGDILGDWREEVVWRTADNAHLRIYTTTIPATNRLPTLLQDPQYRLALVWQNVAYNQPPWPSFYIGPGMKTPPRPNIVTAPSAGVNIRGAVAGKSGPPNARVWTVAVTNIGLGLAQQMEINGVLFAQTHGSPCAPIPSTSFPVVIGDLDPGASGTADVAIDFSGCPADARFTVSILLSANAGPAPRLVRVNQGL